MANAILLGQAKGIAPNDDAREAFLRERLTGIGGSDAGVILGFSKWKTPVDLYLEKIGEKDSFEGNEATRTGNDLEQYVAERYAEVKGVSIRRDRRMFRNEENPFMIAHIDRRIVGQKHGLECKTSLSKFWKDDDWGEEGTDFIPPLYFAQCQHYLSVTGWDSWDLAVLLSGPDFRVYAINRNEKFIKQMIEKEREFWGSVESRTPPPVKVYADCAELYKQSIEDTVVASCEVEEAVETLLKVKAQQKELDGEEDRLKTQIADFMGTDVYLINQQSENLASWKTQDSSRFDTKSFKKDYPELASQFTKTTSSRVMRLAGVLKK